jgi:hypothetical protein
MLADTLDPSFPTTTVSSTRTPRRPVANDFALSLRRAARVKPLIKNKILSPIQDIKTQITKNELITYEDVIPELSYAKNLANLLNEKRRLDT